MLSTFRRETKEKVLSSKLKNKRISLFKFCPINTFMEELIFYLLLFSNSIHEQNIYLNIFIILIQLKAQKSCPLTTCCNTLEKVKPDKALKPMFLCGKPVALLHVFLKLQSQCQSMSCLYLALEVYYESRFLLTSNIVQIAQSTGSPEQGVKL